LFYKNLKMDRQAEIRTIFLKFVHDNVSEKDLETLFKLLDYTYNEYRRTKNISYCMLSLSYLLIYLSRLKILSFFFKLKLIAKSRH